MKRREFITLIGCTAASWPLVARAQQPERMRRVGVLNTLAADDADGQARMGVFLQGLQQSGWTIGGNISIDYRWAAGDADRLRKYAADLAVLAPDVILASGSAALGPLLQATRTVPIVFTVVADPVGAGFVDSLSRPGGNATGFTVFEYGISGKWLELLKEIAPAVKRVGVVFNPETAPFAPLFWQPVLDVAARSFAVAAVQIAVRDGRALAVEIETFAGEPDGGLMVLPDVSTANNRDLIIALAARHRLPAVYPYRYFAASGGLFSYGSDVADVFRRAASYVDRVLKGAKPGDLPVQAPSKYELVINLKTAKALGVEVPPTLLARADEVIE